MGGGVRRDGYRAVNLHESVHNARAILAIIGVFPIWVFTINFYLVIINCSLKTLK